MKVGFENRMIFSEVKLITLQYFKTINFIRRLYDKMILKTRNHRKNIF